MGAVAVGDPPDVVVPVEVLRVRVELQVVLAKLESGEAQHHRLRNPVGPDAHQFVAALKQNEVLMIGAGHAGRVEAGKMAQK